MESNARVFLKDARLEFVELEDHLGIYKDLPFSDKDLEHLSSFWSMAISRKSENEWEIGGTLVRRY